MRRTVRFSLIGLLALACCLAGCASRPAGPKRDFVFFMSSDPHLGFETPKASPPVSREMGKALVRLTISNMVALVGQPYPRLGPLADLPPARVTKPRGVLVAGDLTDNGAWPLFESVFPAAGLDHGSIPLFLCVGNHDGAPDGPARQGVLARNRQHWQQRQVDSISSNGLHYAWSWQGVHFVCVNLCPADSTDSETPFQFGKPGPGSWNDPMGALEFLTDYLRRRVGDSGEPIIIWQHYGYCEGFNFDWNWWSARQRRAFYDVIKPYNVAALLHGHTHAPARYRWPDPKNDPKEVQRLFGDVSPADLRSFDVFSAGSFGGGTYYVFRVFQDQLVAAHRERKGWSSDPRMHLVKSLKAAPALSPVATRPFTKSQ